ncbi:hypothetical protein CVT26_008993 [Gymnopilus dilepis]|uniref:Uncharacterized protein n=1 Tax=Gymnopilus dilepis TaxID=231916 RepID=A0A409YRA4_9AGAR|nr:hypothetical protein CVT26_014297 [Gymnopilus dilepis]PPR05541.1 hypothetical protein CVT26_008993 [Gymnopilus dilepis]
MSTTFRGMSTSFHVCKRIVDEDEETEREIKRALAAAWDFRFQQSVWLKCGWQAEKVNALVTR